MNCSMKGLIYLPKDETSKMYHQDIVREFTVFCSKCGNWERCGGPGEVTYKKSTEYFKSLNWKIISGRWCCPICSGDPQ